MEIVRSRARVECNTAAAAHRAERGTQQRSAHSFTKVHERSSDDDVKRATSSSSTMATAVTLQPLSLRLEDIQHSDDPERIPADSEPTVNSALSYDCESSAERMTNNHETVVRMAQDSPQAACGVSDNDEMDAAMDEILALDENDDEILVSQPGYAGIDNLGNTCYMASSLQMLASVEFFVQSIHEHTTSHETKNKLLESFLELTQQLKNGKTVLIDGFKSIIDERSPLFVGFEQQDAHEFITTLLDLMDVECKKKTSEISDDEETSQNLAAMEETEHTEQVTETRCEEDLVDVPNPLRESPLPSMGSASKRPRTGEHEFSVFHEETSYGLCRSASFSTLDNEGIGELLHGTPTLCREKRSMSVVDSPPRPRCKLIGGRMNAEGVTLIPYLSELRESDVSVRNANRMDRSSTILEDDSGNDETEQETATSISPVDSSFLMTCRARLTCDSCKYTRTQKETFSHLSLEISSESGSVEDGLRRFFAPERRECKCEKCFAETATRTVVITDLPKCLLLHFKRFIVDYSSGYMNISYRKNRSQVAFDDKLLLQEDAVLNEFLDCDCTPDASERLSMSYNLRGVINHIGASASCGHYTADCNRPNLDGEYEWYRFNDEIVQNIEPSVAMERSQSTAYLVLYELQR